MKLMHVASYLPPSYESWHIVAICSQHELFVQWVHSNTYVHIDKKVQFLKMTSTRNDLTLTEKGNLLKKYDRLSKKGQREATVLLGVPQSSLCKLLIGNS